MFSVLRGSLRNKLLLTFTAIGLVPMFVLLIYIIFLSEDKIFEKSISEQKSRAEVVAKLINNNCNTLMNEVVFLSTLDVMDDFLAEDIDKRISRLLNQKIKDLNLEASLIGFNNEHTIIASSDINTLLKKFPLNQYCKGAKGSFILNKNLYFYARVNASFDKTKHLGFLVLRYNLNNLKSYLINNSSTHSYFIDPKKHLTVGRELSTNVDLNTSLDTFTDAKSLIVYKQMKEYLNGWYIVYAVDKTVALAFLYDFVRFLSYMVVVIIVLILYSAIKFAKSTVEPIENLTVIADNTIRTKDYATSLEVEVEDEVARLTHSFNELLKTTNNALTELKEESKYRLKMFTQLIDIFNVIIQTKTQDECLQTSIDEIKKLTGKDILSFCKTKKSVEFKEYIALYINDFEKNEQVCIGFIELDLHNISDENERRFYYSIVSMITLQIDKINLINRTISASRAKSAFISHMSHELRTPLNSIIGFTQYLIAYEELNDDQQDTVANIESSAQYLLGMINEILDIAKIESGKMDVHKEEVDLPELVASTYEMLYPLAEDKEIEFTLNSENYTLESYNTDPKLFRQVIINLISNAIKFTDKGFVSILLYNDEHRVYVKVKDSGIGINEDDIKLLFSDFTQIENNMQKKYKGSGLGLALSKKIAVMLGGDVTLSSEGLGKGVETLFWIELNP